MIRSLLQELQKESNKFRRRREIEDEMSILINDSDVADNDSVQINDSGDQWDDLKDHEFIKSWNDIESYIPDRLRETKRWVPPSSGYVFVNGHKGHPNADYYGRIAEHILVMSISIGRPLRRKENVHHKNGRRDDNRLENLELWDKTQPSGQRQGDLIEWAISIIERHGTHPHLRKAMEDALK